MQICKDVRWSVWSRCQLRSRLRARTTHRTFGNTVTHRLLLKQEYVREFTSNQSPCVFMCTQSFANTHTHTHNSTAWCVCVFLLMSPWHRAEVVQDAWCCLRTAGCRPPWGERCFVSVGGTMRDMLVDKYKRTHSKYFLLKTEIPTNENCKLLDNLMPQTMHD